MAASLEQIQILSREYDLAEHEYQKALDAMRRLVTSAMYSMPHQIFTGFVLIFVLHPMLTNLYCLSLDLIKNAFLS